MKIFLTTFKSIFDNRTHKSMVFGDFDEFEKLLYNLSTQRRETKQGSPLISPAVYVTDDIASEYPKAIKESNKDGTAKPWYHRKNVNVIKWGGWAAVDVDDITIQGGIKDYVLRKFGHYNFVCYSTASSTSDHPKFRLVFPLTEDVEASKIKAFWYALNTELDFIGDKQTKDLSRMYYVPANYVGAYNFIFSNHRGSDIDPDVLIKKHPMPASQTGNTFFDNLPADVQKMIIDHRKSQLDNTNYSWLSYRDCPFFPQKLANEYKAITETGWYAKMYAIMVATASRAVEKKYPITAKEIGDLCRELDHETGSWYEDRPIEEEANRAIEFVYRNM